MSKEGGGWELRWPVTFRMYHIHTTQKIAPIGAILRLCQQKFAIANCTSSLTFNVQSFT